MFDWLRIKIIKDEDLSFRLYIRKSKKSKSEVLRENAHEFEYRVPELFMSYYPNMSYSEIQNMKWGEVDYRLRLVTKKMAEQYEKLTSMKPNMNVNTSRLFDDLQWQYRLDNTAFERR